MQSDPGQIELSPPAPLVAPAPAPLVEPASAATAVKLSADQTAALDAEVASFAQGLLDADVNSPNFEAQVNKINSIGAAEIRQAAGVSNRLLDRPTRAMNAGLFDEKSSISKGLLDLRRTVESLSPRSQGDLFSPRKLLGIIPFGNKIQDYFRGYQSSQAHLNAIINTLFEGKDELLKDNAAIDQERSSLWTLMQKLAQYNYLAQKIDDSLSAKVGALESSDPAKARAVKEKALFYVRQRRQDILTQMAVNVQAYLALNIIRENNVELVKGVDRATGTTVSALRTAILVAQALTNQRLVLGEITALNATTSDLIETTGKLLREQTTQIGQQAASATIDIGVLQHAFDNVFAALDDVSTYKVKALDSMSATVGALTTQVNRASEYLAREKEARAAVKEIAGDTAPDGTVRIQ